MHRLILFINEHLELCNEKRIFLLTKLGKISEVLTSIDHQNRALIMVRSFYFVFDWMVSSRKMLNLDLLVHCSCIAFRNINMQWKKQCNKNVKNRGAFVRVERFLLKETSSPIY